MTFASGRGFRTSPVFRSSPIFRVDGGLGGGGGIPPPDPAPTIVSGPTLVSKTADSVRLTWTADQFVQSWLEYGLTTSYGSESTHEESFTYSTHTQTISGLLPDTEYHFRPVVVNSVSQITYGSDISVTTDSSGTVVPSDDLYGVPQFLTGVGNQRLIQDLGLGTVTVATYRFRASRTGYVRTVRWSNTTGGGYSSGSPTARISLQADDGTSLHAPTRVILSQCPNFTPATSDNAGTLSTFSTPYQVTQGQLYHIVFENLSADAAANTYSINCIVVDGGGDNISPRWGSGALDWGAPFWNNGAWMTQNGIAHRPGYWPILGIGYSDTAGGAITGYQGQGFVSMGDAMLISGNTQIRERIIVSGSSRTVVGVLIFAECVSGTGSLTVSLDDSGGTALATATFPYTDFVIGTGVRNAAPNPTPVAERLLSVSRTLSLGSTYYARLSCPSGTTYMMEAMTKGNGWGYDSSLSFPDGVRQQTTGGAGGSWTTFGNTDCQVMFRTGGS